MVCGKWSEEGGEVKGERGDRGGGEGVSCWGCGARDG